MLKKKPVRGSDKISVTFETRSHTDAGRISLVGEFNDWNPLRHPMRKRKDGAWSATVRLDSGQRYQYRFLVDETEWATDVEADAVVVNPYGEENSVVALAGPED
ncbi:MAG: isoamylase early set domain-containing protein [Acidobacteriota bacterium]|nr:isoamylase early set domain-containing protein [Acidobacteriota bacterium]